MQDRAIQSIIPVALFVAAACCSGRLMAQSQGAADGVITDRDGNIYRVKVLLDGKLWMGSNLTMKIPNSYYYGDTARAFLGRLYTWKSATQGCKLLGKGWRLPTLSELRQLTALYGGAGDSNQVRKQAFSALLYPGASGFDARPGGGRDPDGKYARLNAHGFYWTSTECDSSSAWYWNFAKGSGALYLQDGGEKTRAFSVRCVNGQ